MKIKIYYDGRRTDSISASLQLALEEKVELPLIEALSPFENELSAYDYTVNISLSADYNSILILMDGLSDNLRKRTEESITRTLACNMVFADLVQPEHMPSY